MRVLVCGDRNWTVIGPIFDRLLRLRREAGPDAEVICIHGDARGADRLVGQVATELRFVVMGIPADWKQYGRAAGPIRNRIMLDMKPDLVIAFHPDLTKSKGTADCVREARRCGIAVEVIGGRNEN